MKKTKNHDDLKLIKKAASGSSVAILELCRKYEGVYIKSVRRFFSSRNRLLSEMMEDKLYFFYDASKKFDKKRGVAFSTYVYNMAGWKCLNVLKREGRINEKMLELADMQILNSNYEAPRFDDFDVLGEIQKFDKRAQYIFNRRFFSDGKRNCSFHQIGKELNLSCEGVRLIYNNHLKILQSKIKNEINS